ncbi:hypothetical protein PC121_g14697 [Phytophthora cactorum]|nr:hypothetical protein PC120_g20550 [Phytophthora cactorum]KAG3057770.1 hypothetical protein PC121_g14697 [Phytophthora cactorum]
MNRKLKSIIGKEMITGTMMWNQVVAQLPSEIWASSIELSEGAFTVENMECALKQSLGDMPKKMIIGTGESSSVTRSNHVKKDRVMRGYNTKERKWDTGGVQEQRCFYWGHDALHPPPCATP